MGQAIARSRHPAGVIGALILLGGLLALVLTCCPSNRDGMPGQLATAKEETQSAARSAALAVQLWSDGQSPGSLAAVQISDARDEVVKAYKDIAELKANNHIDLDRQRLLTGAMTGMIDDLNAASASLRGDAPTGDPQQLRQHLLSRADALEQAYR